jgi:mutator protein MutT
MVAVVAALIEFQGKVLVCQRRPSDRFGLLWEFPGGKVESGEEFADALRRELFEELGVSAPVGPEVYRTVFKYREMREPTELVFFAAAVNPAEARNLQFERMEWRAPATLSELEFLPADRELVALLSSGALKIPDGWKNLSRAATPASETV